MGSVKENLNEGKKTWQRADTGRGHALIKITHGGRGEEGAKEELRAALAPAWRLRAEAHSAVREFMQL